MSDSKDFRYKLASFIHYKQRKMLISAHYCSDSCIWEPIWPFITSPQSPARFGGWKPLKNVTIVELMISWSALLTWCHARLLWWVELKSHLSHVTPTASHILWIIHENYCWSHHKYYRIAFEWIMSTKLIFL